MEQNKLVSRRTFLKVAGAARVGFLLNPKGFARVVLAAPGAASSETLAPARVLWPGKYQEVRPGGKENKNYWLCGLPKGSVFNLVVNDRASIAAIASAKLKNEPVGTRLVTLPYPLIDVSGSDRLFTIDTKSGRLGGKMQLSTFVDGWRVTGELSREKFAFLVAGAQRERMVAGLRTHKATGDVPDLDNWVAEFLKADKVCSLPSLEVLKVLVDGAWANKDIEEMLQLIVQTQGNKSVELEAGIVQLLGEKARFVTGGHFVARMLTCELPGQQIILEQFPFGISSRIWRWFGKQRINYEEKAMVGGHGLMPSYDPNTRTIEMGDFLAGFHCYVIRENGELSVLLSGGAGANYLKDVVTGLDQTYGGSKWRLIMADSSTYMALGVYYKSGSGAVRLTNTLGRIAAYDHSEGGTKYTETDFGRRKLVAYTIFPPATRDSE